ncbi:DNA polymerase phi-domain-containing protein [Crassisporium funariophilum]|nr:DNA polymerase phi-domain-containing protein [Crassisporium funariophilum]
MTTTLPLFWHLSSAKKRDRIDASVKLVGALEQFQTQFVQKPVASASASDEEEEEDGEPKSDGLNLLNAQDVVYSIRRLIRGLGSPRESSRLGFAVALTELLSRIDTVTCPQVLSLITESTKNQGSMNGQDERDVLFARLFGIMSVIQSGLAVRTTPLPTSGPSTTLASSLESFEDIITQLVSLGESKSWLRESAWFALSLAIGALHESGVSWKDEAVGKTLVHLFVENQIWSTEKLALALKLQDLYPGREWKTLLSPAFKNPDLLSSGNLINISRILKESATDEDGAKDPTKAPSGTWKPQLNFAWDIILDQMLPSPNNTKPVKGSFQDFYRVVVDESLFSSTSSPQRKYWGFQVFQKALSRITEDSMPMLFTKNFMRSWINHLSKRDRYLHKVAQQTVTEVQAVVKDKPQLGFALILQLTGVNGSQQFDRLTKTKTVESILSNLDAKGIQQYIDYLMSQINEGDGSNIAVLNTRRAWIIDQLGSLIHNGGIPKEDGWVQSVLDWLVINGLFGIKKKSSKSSFPALRNIPTPAFSDILRQNCRVRLLSCLSDLNTQTSVVKSGEKSTKASAVAADGEFWIAKVLSTIELLEADEKHVVLLAEVDKEDDEYALRARAKKTIAKLRKISGEQQETARGGELLILGTLLSHYCAGDDEENEDPDALESCVDGATRMLLSDGKQKKTKDLADQTAEEPIDVLVDTIIGFLEKSTAYMRTVGNQVFSLLSGSVKDSTIDLIVTQLERRDPSRTAEDDDEDEDMEDIGEDDEGAEGVDDSDSDDANASQDEDSGDDSNDEEADLELRNKIEEALRVNGIEPASGETDSEEDEELMNDDQMMAIDEQLAQVFRSRTNEKKSGKDVDAQREATHFKNRVLDLVDTFIRKQPSSPHVLRLISPLIDLVAGSSQDEQQLSDKAKGILRSRIGKTKEFPTEVEAEQVLLISQNLHIQARKTHSSDLLSLLSICSLYLSKIMVHLKAEESLQTLYKDSLVDFTTRKNSALNASFFQDFIRRFPIQAWCLRGDILDLCRKSINSYRQCQVLQLLELLVSLLPSMDVRAEEVVEFMPLLRQLLLDVADDSCTDKANLSTAQMKELLKLGLVAVRQTKRIAPTATEAAWQPKSWRSLHESLTNSVRLKASPALQKMCEQIARMSEDSGSLSNSKPTKSKRKVDDVIETEGASTTPAPKKSNKRKKIRVDKS